MSEQSGSSLDEMEGMEGSNDPEQGKKSHNDNIKIYMRKFQKPLMYLSLPG